MRMTDHILAERLAGLGWKVGYGFGFYHYTAPDDRPPTFLDTRKNPKSYWSHAHWDFVKKLLQLEGKEIHGDKG